jgi:hypothetical protein
LRLCEMADELGDPRVFYIEENDDLNATKV